MIVNLVITKLDENGGQLETEFARLVESLELITTVIFDELP